MNVKTWLSLVVRHRLVELLTMFASTSLGATVYTEVVNGVEWTYTISDGYASVGGNSSSSPAIPTETTGVLAIPTTLAGVPVTGIGKYAFYNCNSLTGITIPNSVTNIGERAFWKCGKLSHATIGDGVIDVGDSAFNCCSNMVAVTLGKRIRRIGDYAFAWCTGLSCIAIPNQVSLIGERAFYKCTGLDDVSLGIGITTIEAAAFYGCVNLTAMEFPMNLTNISHEVFRGCSSLMDITIPDSVINIGSNVFYKCTGLKSVKIGSGINNIGSDAFSYCTNLATVLISDVAQWCQINFHNTTANPLSYAHRLYHNGVLVETLAIPVGVTNIRNYAFNGCSSLKSVIVPDGVINLGFRAFAQCNSLKSITLPKSVTGINSGAFAWCTSLEEMTLPFIGSQRGHSGDYDDVFGYIFGSVLTQDGMTMTRQYFSDSSSRTYAIPPSLRRVIVTDERQLGYGAFYGCSGLTNVTISSTVTNIGASAFWGCSGLTEFEIPYGVMNIDRSAFNGCSDLTSILVDPQNASYSSVNGLLLSKDGRLLIAGVNGIVNIPDGVATINDFAFAGCTGLISVILPNSVMSIGNEAFKGCDGLKDIVISGSVKHLGVRAFEDCGGLKSVTVSQCICTNHLSSVFPQSYYSIEKVTVQEGVSSLADRIFYDCAKLTNVTIPNTITNIGDNAFVGCPRLRDVTVPQYICSLKLSSIFPTYQAITNVIIVEGVTTIETNAFDGCRNLISVTIPSSVTNVGASAFNKCNGLTKVNVSDIAAWCRVTFGNAFSNPLFYAHNLYVNGMVASSITLPDNVSSVGSYAFCNCTNLVNIEIGNSVKSIENQAFYQCSTLVSIRIPDNVVHIGDSAFYGCVNLTAVSIGSGVMRIGNAAFCNCHELVNVDFTGNAPQIGNNVFNGVAQFCRGSIRNGSTGWGVPIPSTWNGITLDYIQHDVIFEANGGTCDVASVCVADGLPIGTLPTPVLTNAVFLGWFTSADGGSRMDEAMIVTQSTTLYAHWLPQTLNEAMDVDVSVRLATSEINPWMPVFDSTAKVGDTTARSGAIGDRTNTWITATVSGVGTMSFWLKTSCEHDDDENALTADRLMVYTNGVEIVEWRMDGETDWTRREVSFAGGENTVKWVYYKDKSGVGGEDCAWVDGVMWTLTDPIPPIVSDSEVLTALAGTTDVNLTANVTNAAQYTAYRAWALSVTNDTTTAQMIKESTRTWLSFALGADALIGKELTSDDVKIESFTPASTDGKFEFTVRVKDVNIGGGSVAVETLKENLKKVLGIEGSATLSPSGFSSDNIDITFDTPVAGKSRFTVTPPVDAGNSFFMRVKVK